MNKCPRAVALCIALSLAALGGDVHSEQLAESAAERTTYTVSIANMQFEPAELIVERGSRIVWVNKDFFPHTATAQDGIFDSASIGTSATWQHVAGQKGSFPYFCTLHPMMKGTLVVE